MTADVSLTIRYAALSGPKIGHLLPRTVPKGRRKGRPSLCGIWRQQWRPVERTDDPTAYSACAGCSTAAGIRPAPPRPLIPEPAGRAHRTHPYDVVSVRAELVDPQEARVALPERHRVLVGHRHTTDGRPCDRYGIPLAPAAIDYRPQPYEQRVPQD